MEKENNSKTKELSEAQLEAISKELLKDDEIVLTVMRSNEDLYKNAVKRLINSNEFMEKLEEVIKEMQKDEKEQEQIEKRMTREELEQKAENKKQEVKNLEEEERKIDDLEKTIEKKEQQENKSIT